MEKRGANFTKNEIDILTDIVYKYKHVIENKISDAVTWKDKNDAWDRISIEFNAASGNFPRTAKTLRSKYETIKKVLRKKCAYIRGQQIATGGGSQCTTKLTDNEDRILALTPNTIVGMTSIFDSDDAGKY